jgi:hypothetical protein
LYHSTPERCNLIRPVRCLDVCQAMFL